MLQTTFGSFREEKGDLFALDNTWSLAHCVGADFQMGAGIATEFKKRFGSVDELLKQKKGVGEVATLQVDGRSIFYLVTKESSSKSKPTYESIEKAVQEMFAIASKHGISKLAMPRIGCGLDRLQWTVVKEIVLKHKPMEMSVVVRYL